MKLKATVFVLSGVILIMFLLGIGLSQTTKTVENSNLAANCTEADRRPRKLANGGNWDPETERLRNIDANTGGLISNGRWDANCARWHYDHDAANLGANAAVQSDFNSANSVRNTNTKTVRKPTPRKRTRRP